MPEKKADWKLKLRFYIISLHILFILLFMLTVDICGCFIDNHFIGLLPALFKNWFPGICLLFAAISLILTAGTEKEWAGSANLPYEIETIKNENYEYLSFLTTYIIPLVCIDLSNKRNVVLLAILLVLIGLVFIRTNLYYGNPTLALMKYKLYRVSIKNVDAPDGIILISKDRLKKGSYVKWIRIDEYVWVAKEIKNDT